MVVGAGFVLVLLRVVVIRLVVAHGIKHLANGDPFADGRVACENLAQLFGHAGVFVPDGRIIDGVDALGHTERRRRRHVAVLVGWEMKKKWDLKDIKSCLENPQKLWTINRLVYIRIFIDSLCRPRLSHLYL